MSEQTLGSISKTYLRETLISTGGLLIFLSVCASPIWIGFYLEPRPYDFGLFTYAILGIIGWSVYFGQDLGLYRMKTPPEEREAEDEDNFGQLIIAILYFNIILFIGVLLASVFHIAGASFLSVLVAIGYPIYDTETAYRSIPLSFGGVAAFVLVGLSFLWKQVSRAARRIDWSTLQYDRLLLRRYLSLLERGRPGVR